MCERIVTVRGKRIRIQCPANGHVANIAIMVSHGRFLPVQRYLTGTAEALILVGLKVNHYVHDKETITSTEASRVLYKLHYGRAVESVKDYSERQTFKNYTLRADHGPLSSYQSGAYHDQITPIDIVRIQDVFEGVRMGVLPYTELRIISCRAYRLTASGLI